MKLTIEELISSPFLTDLEHTLEQLEDTEYRVNGNFTKLLYKGLPYLIKQGENKYTLLGYTWLYGTGSMTKPYYPPREHLIPCFDLPDILAGIRYISGKCKVPSPGKFPEYAESKLGGMYATS